jgi:Holliday junction resolvase|tara:strand:- start:475 stop:822 length:348 start_codon:yes stop_codon:yes gene_type:complete
MPSKASRKGYSGEVEVVRLLEDLGFAAERSWGSDGRSFGEKSDIDVKATKGDLTILVQVKRRKKIADYLTFRNADIVMVRQDFKPWVWIVKNDVMAKILDGVKNVFSSPTHENGE